MRWPVTVFVVCPFDGHAVERGIWTSCPFAGRLTFLPLKESGGPDRPHCQQFGVKFPRPEAAGETPGRGLDNQAAVMVFAARRSWLREAISLRPRRPIGKRPVLTR